MLPTIILFGIVLFLYFGINVLGNNNILWAPIGSGKIFVVMRNKQARMYFGNPSFDAWVDPKTGKVTELEVDGDGLLVGRKPRERNILQALSNHIWGFKWIGLWPVNQLHRYTQTWETIASDGKTLLKHPEGGNNKGEETNHLRYQYAYAKEVEVDLDGIPLKVVFVVNLRITHAGLALMKQSNYLSQVFSILIEATRKYVTQFNSSNPDTESLEETGPVSESTSGFEMFRTHDHGDEEERPTLPNGKELTPFKTTLEECNPKLGDYGVKIESIQWNDYSAPPEIEAAARKKFLAEQEATAKKLSAEADAHAIRVKGDAEAGAIKKRVESGGQKREEIAAFDGGLRTIVGDPTKIVIDPTRED